MVLLSSSTKFALVSVSDKTALEPLVKTLSEYNINLTASSGTASFLRSLQLPVTDVSEITKFPEMMGGRLKTISPLIVGGILARIERDDAELEAHNIPPINFVIVNLYPFSDVIAEPDCTFERSVENIDIGGSLLIRAAAKNHDRVTVLVDPKDYSLVIDDLKANNGQVSQALRYKLALKAYQHTAKYDQTIADYMASTAQKMGHCDSVEHSVKSLPAELLIDNHKLQDLRYGENPHQKAGLFQLATNTKIEGLTKQAGIATADVLQGKELSYNNLVDADAALRTVSALETCACAIIKHSIPCGVAIADSASQAYSLAFSADQLAAFGGVIAFNVDLDATVAQKILETQFVEVVIAPNISPEAQEIFSAKKNVRVIKAALCNQPFLPMDLRVISGNGLLVQISDGKVNQREDWKVVSKRHPTEEEIRDLYFAWIVCSFVKSNAIVFAKGRVTLGIGAGQVSRVMSTRIAGIKAGDNNQCLEGSVMASDAFLPFRDNLDEAARLGVKAVVQTGGSIRDNELIEAADEHNIAMIFTGERHFRH